MMEQPNAGLRLAAMLFDHFAMVFIIVGTAFIIMSPFILISNYDFTNLNNSDLSKSIGVFVVAPIMLTLISTYFNKDIFNGRSVAKRALKLQVVDNETGQVATPLKCLLRNTTIIIWPVEVLITLFSPNRRLGDYIARTRVAFYKPDQVAKIEWRQILIATVLGLLFLLVSFGLVLLIQVITGPIELGKIASP